MMFTGTLIEDLIATVERVQQKTRSEAERSTEMEPWFASGQDSASCENKLLGVA
jgi:hypothetical protein